jgi:hypothetical protein
MIKIIKSPNILYTLISRLFCDKTYNKYYKYKFSIEEYKKYLMVKRLLKPYQGKYKRISKYMKLDNKSFEPKSGCVVTLICTLEQEEIISVDIAEKYFTIGDILYSFELDGIYTDTLNNPICSFLKRRNKLEKQYT